jgi:hypothetical protein
VVEENCSPHGSRKGGGRETKKEGGKGPEVRYTIQRHASSDLPPTKPHLLTFSYELMNGLFH